MDRPVRPPARPQERRPLTIDPRGGAVGTVVSLNATGLPPESTLLVAFANLQSYQLLKEVVTDADGSFATTQAVPPWAELDGVHYFFASFSDERPLALSNGFHVTAEDGIVRLEGTIGVRAEDGCVELTNQGDVLYHLVGDMEERQAGARVALVGTIGDASACNGAGIVVAVSDSMMLPG